MIKTVTVINHLGESLKLELARPEESGFVVKKIEGLGPSKADILTTEVITNDGSVFNFARSEQRDITITLDFSYFTSIEDARHETYKYFPTRKPLDLIIETDNRRVRTKGYVESNEPDIFSKKEGCQISIICPDPNFYLDGDTEGALLNGVRKNFEFPFENNSLIEPLIEFGAIQYKKEENVYYDGDSDIGVTITIDAIGEAENITIYNTGTRQVMRIDTDKIAAITGSGIISGDRITICTEKGYKSITLLRGGDEYNILNCLAKNVDWFHLTKGDNVFAFAAERGTVNIQMVITYRVIYEGV